MNLAYDLTKRRIELWRAPAKILVWGSSNYNLNNLAHVEILSFNCQAEALSIFLFHREISEASYGFS